MDARITKQRLSNLISYDWLKMLGTILAFILVLVLLFTMTATRPRQDQEYTIYAHTDLQADTAFSGLGDTLLGREVFSYDILTVTAESFSGNSYASSVFQARRAAGQGTVMFMTDNPTYETDEEGNYVLGDDGQPVISAQSELYSFAGGSAVTADASSPSAIYDTVYYLEMCEEYLAQFFGGDWETDAAFDGSTSPEQSFERRNGEDKRYRTQEQRVQGVEEERDRLLKLRENYLFVRDAFADGTLSHTAYDFEGEDGTVTTLHLGIDVGGLNGLKNLVYYTDGEGSRTTENVNLVILYNNYLFGQDLNFETVSFLRYLVETYR